jgi:tetratricopeptide (TPR) repeat protein
MLLKTSFTSLFHHIRAQLLLTPETLLLIIFLGMYYGFGSAPLVAVGLALVIVVFIARLGALELARRALALERYRDAAALLQVAGWFYPWSADLLALRGSFHLAKGSPDLAEPLFRRSLRLYPQQPASLHALAIALLKQGNTDAAMAAVLQALEQTPNSAYALLTLAEAEQAAGLAPTRIEDHLRAGVDAALTPDEQATLHSALAAHLFAQQRSAEGNLALRNAEALLGQCSRQREAQLRSYLGELLATQGQLERAHEHLQRSDTLGMRVRQAATAAHS